MYHCTWPNDGFLSAGRCLCVFIWLAACCIGVASNVDVNPMRACCTGVHLDVALPAISYEPYYVRDDKAGHGGFFLQVLDDLSKELGFAYSVHTTPQFLPKTVSNVTQWPYDMCFVDLHDPAEHSRATALHFLYTAPFYSSYYSGLVLKTKVPVSLFQLFDPFSPGLWLMLFGFVVVAVLLVLLMNAIAPSQEFADHPLSERVSVAIALKTLYHMSAAMLEGEDYEWTSWPGRVSTAL